MDFQVASASCGELDPGQVFSNPSMTKLLPVLILVFAGCAREPELNEKLIRTGRELLEKEAIIEEMEFLIGFPSLLKNHAGAEAMDGETRKGILTEINEVNPQDPYYLKLVQLREGLLEIQSTDKTFGYGAKTIGGPDPELHLTLNGHIRVQSMELEMRRSRIEQLSDRVGALEKELQGYKKELNAFIMLSKRWGLQFDKQGKFLDSKISEINDLEEKLEQLRNYSKTLKGHIDPIPDGSLEMLKVLQQENLELRRELQILQAKLSQE